MFSHAAKIQLTTQSLFHGFSVTKQLKLGHLDFFGENSKIPMFEFFFSSFSHLFMSIVVSFDYCKCICATLFMFWCRCFFYLCSCTLKVGHTSCAQFSICCNRKQPPRSSVSFLPYIIVCFRVCFCMIPSSAFWKQMGFTSSPNLFLCLDLIPYMSQT